MFSGLIGTWDAKMLDSSPVLAPEGYELQCPTNFLAPRIVASRPLDFIGLWNFKINVRGWYWIADFLLCPVKSPDNANTS